MRVYLGVALFCIVVGLIYGVFASEEAGKVLFAGAAGFGIVGGFALWALSRGTRPGPDDDASAQVADGEGEIGYFADSSPWPAAIALGFATVLNGAVIGGWLVALGLPILIVSVFGFAFERAGG